MIQIICTNFSEIQKDLSELTVVNSNKIKILNMRDPQHLAFPIVEIENNKLYVRIPWFCSSPPIFFAKPIDYQSSDLIAIIYALLSDFESANEYIDEQSAAFEYLKLYYSFTGHFSLKNHHFEANAFGYAYQALAYHYGLIEDENAVNNAYNYYKKALKLSQNNEQSAFITKHLCILLNDLQAQEELIMTACEARAKNISESAQIGLLNELYAADLSFANETSNYKKIKEIEANIATCIQFYQTQSLPIQEGFSLFDAALIAQIQKNYAESLAHLNKANKQFTENFAKDLSFMVDLQKGKLLLLWAQTGQLQFYREALKSFQQALKGYSAEENPEIYAEIQHQLGIIYAEIPDEIQKRSIWMGLSLTAFDEALQYFSKENAPYEYALICSHVGNAYTKFPTSESQVPNLLKALKWYQKALEIRTPIHYPKERALTLLNYLEILSSFKYTDERKNTQKQEITQLANEVIRLTSQADLQQIAQTYLIQKEEI